MTPLDIRWAAYRKAKAASNAGFSKPAPGSYLTLIEESVRRKHVQPIESVDELRPDVFESNNELVSTSPTCAPSGTSTSPDRCR